MDEVLHRVSRHDLRVVALGVRWRQALVEHLDLGVVREEDVRPSDERRLRDRRESRERLRVGPVEADVRLAVGDARDRAGSFGRSLGVAHLTPPELCELLRVRLHPEARPARHHDVSLGVHSHGLFEVPLEVVGGHQRRLAEHLEVGGVGDGAGEVEVRHQPDAAAAVVGRHQLTVELGQRADLAQAAHRLRDHRLRLDDVVDVLFHQPAELVEPAVVLAASDVQLLDRRAQLAQPLEVVAVQRLLQPEDAQALQLPGGLKGALEGPDRPFLRLAGAGLLGLVGVHQDHEVVAHRPPDAFDLRDVFLDGPVVQPELDRAPALGAAGGSVLGALLAGPDLDAARVAGHAVLVAAPQLVDRLAGRLPDKVPEGDLDAPGATRVAKEAGVLFERERVLANELGLEPLVDGRHVRGVEGAPAADALVGVDAHQRGLGADAGAARCPGWLERARMLR